MNNHHLLLSLSCNLFGVLTGGRDGGEKMSIAITSGLEKEKNLES